MAPANKKSTANNVVSLAEFRRARTVNPTPPKRPAGAKARPARIMLAELIVGAVVAEYQRGINRTK